MSCEAVSSVWVSRWKAITNAMAKTGIHVWPETPRELGTATGPQLETDLVGIDRVADTLEESLRSFEVRDVEGKHDSRAGVVATSGERAHRGVILA